MDTEAFVLSVIGIQAHFLVVTVSVCALNSDYFPIWGTCLGHQLLTACVTGDDVLSVAPIFDEMSRLELVDENVDVSRFFSRAPRDVRTLFETAHIAYNYHKWAMLCSTFDTNVHLRNEWRVLATNRESAHGELYVSLMEHRSAPFYGSQFHPESSAFNWRLYNEGARHDFDAVIIIHTRFITV
jgi:gamma-glutamyl hydrolase